MRERKGNIRQNHKLKAALNKLLERRNTETMEFPSHLLKQKALKMLGAVTNSILRHKIQVWLATPYPACWL